MRIQQYFINNPEDNADLSDEERERLKLLRKKKLAQMVAYCEGEVCLRQYILSYFGEKSEKCGNCSCCSGVLTSVDVTTAAQKIFSCIKRLSEKENSATVRDVLKGNLTSYIKQKGLDAVSTFGIMNDSAESVIDEHISYFLERGFISAARDGGLSLKRKCTAVLRGERAVRKLIERQSRKTEARPDIMLLMKLKKLRQECARKASVPDFIILTDVALSALARRKPKSVQELADIPGLSMAKIQKYGPVFLKEINRHCNENLENKQIK